MNKNRTIEELEPDEYNEAVGYLQKSCYYSFFKY